MTATAPFNTTQRQQPGIRPPDDETILPQKQVKEMQEPRKVDKRSTEYVLKSGFAGGLAGCAVCSHHPEA